MKGFSKPPQTRRSIVVTPYAPSHVLRLEDSLWNLRKCNIAQARSVLRGSPTSPPGISRPGAQRRAEGRRVGRADRAEAAEAPRGEAAVGWVGGAVPAPRGRVETSHFASLEN